MGKCLKEIEKMAIDKNLIDTDGAVTTATNLDADIETNEDHNTCVDPKILYWESVEMY